MLITHEINSMEVVIGRKVQMVYRLLCWMYDTAPTQKFGFMELKIKKAAIQELLSINTIEIILIKTLIRKQMNFQSMIQKCFQCCYLIQSTTYTVIFMLNMHIKGV